MNHEISVIIPAFNEADRLPHYLASVHDYLLAVFGDDHEVIVVDDGSLDETSIQLSRLAINWPQLRLLTHAVNRGKGAAVRTGILASVGQRVLFTDADGASPIEEEAKLRSEVDRGADLVVGSRLLAKNGRTPGRSWHRDLAGRLFARVGRLVMGVSPHDTQCGFKMFRGDVGRRLFRTCSIDDYLFDLYILAMAERLKLNVAEVSVRWSDQPGSKVHLIRDSLRMIAGLGRVRSLVRHDAQEEMVHSSSSPARLV